MFFLGFMKEGAPDSDLLFWQEYPPFYVYFVMGVSEQTQGISDSNTSPGQTRYYYIYFDIEENGEKQRPDYRNISNLNSPKWSTSLDTPYAFTGTSFPNPHSISLPQNYFPVFMNVSSPSVGDIDCNGIIDIVTGLRDGNVTAIRGTDGSIIWKRAIIPKISQINAYPNYKVYADRRLPTIGDINHDNILEVVAGGANIESTIIGAPI